MKKTLFFLILFFIAVCTPTICFKASLAGLNLWALKVMPGLLIAFILTACVLKTFKISSRFGVIYIIFSGLLCGFPTGAYSCMSYHKNNPQETLSKNLIAYCNISSPSFVINFIYGELLRGTIPLYKMLLCCYLPVLLLITWSLLHHKDKHLPQNTYQKSGSFAEPQTKESDIPDIIDEAIYEAVRNMLKLGGYIILFSCASAYINILLSRFGIISPIVCGIVEITNGMYLLADSIREPALKTVIVLTINAFGGLSTLMQTIGITSGYKINIKKYIYQKLTLSALTALTTVLLVYVL